MIVEELKKEEKAGGKRIFLRLLKDNRRGIFTINLGKSIFVT